MKIITKAPFALVVVVACMPFSEAAAVCELDPSGPALPDQPTWIDHLQRYVGARKSYSGSLNDAQAPAEVAYENPDGADSYARIDVAVRFVGWDCSRAGKTRLRHRIRPATVEYHRSHNSLEQTKKTSLSALYQADLGFDDDFTNTLLTDLKYERTRDSILNQTVGAASLLFGWASDTQGLPGYIFRTGTRKQWLRYNLSAGYERYDKLAIKLKQGDTTTVIAPEVDEDFYAGRVNIDLRLFPDALGQNLVLTGSHTWRRLKGESEFIADNTRLLELSLDYYVDAKKRIAFGVSYSRGHNPRRNFLDEEVSAVGFKFKLRE
jgi:hypothetical protein